MNSTETRTGPILEAKAALYSPGHITFQVNYAGQPGEAWREYNVALTEALLRLIPDSDTSGIDPLNCGHDLAIKVTKVNDEWQAICLQPEELNRRLRQLPEPAVTTFYDLPPDGEARTVFVLLGFEPTAETLGLLGSTLEADTNSAGAKTVAKVTFMEAHSANSMLLKVNLTRAARGLGPDRYRTLLNGALRIV